MVKITPFLNKNQTKNLEVWTKATASNRWIMVFSFCIFTDKKSRYILAQFTYFLTNLCTLKYQT